MTRARDLAAFVSNADGDIKFDTDTLFIDSSTNRVGIGTSTPDYKLEVEETSASSFISVISSNTTETGVIFGDTDANARGGVVYDNSDNALEFRTNNNSERMRIDNSGNVGIGTSSPTGVPTTTLHINGTTNAGIHITDSASGATDSDGVYLSMDSPNLYVQNKEAGFTAFETSGTERMRILAGGGLTFNGDTAAANAIDDYEEGTFTPTITEGGSGFSYQVQEGIYTKIGNIVKIQGKISGFSDRTTSNNVQVSSLPFSTLSNQAAGSIFCRYATGEPTAIYADSNRLTFYASSSGAYSNLQHNELNNASADIYFAGVYQVA